MKEGAVGDVNNHAPLIHSVFWFATVMSSEPTAICFRTDVRCYPNGPPVLQQQFHKPFHIQLYYSCASSGLSLTYLQSYFFSYGWLHFLSSLRLLMSHRESWTVLLQQPQSVQVAPLALRFTGDAFLIMPPSHL